MGSKELDMTEHKAQTWNWGFPGRVCQVPWKVTQDVSINEVGSFREVEEPWMKHGGAQGYEGNTGVDG